MKNDKAKNITYIKLFRSILDNKIVWNNRKPFDERSAWISLLLFATNKEYEYSVADKEIYLLPGQFSFSLSFLCNYWHWSNKMKVQRYLSKLQKNGMITIEKKVNQNIITICNYEEYQTNKTNTAKNRRNNVTGNNTENQTNTADNVTKSILEIKELKSVTGNVIESVTEDVTGNNTENQTNTADNVTGNVIESVTEDVTNKKNIYKKNDNKKEKVFTNVNTKNAYVSSEIENKFKLFCQWIEEKTLYVKKMEQQMTLANYINLKKSYSAKQITTQLLAMDNYKKHNKTIEKQHVSVYRTLIDYLKREYK